MAIGPGRIAGIASLYINGVPVPTKGACHYKPNTLKREMIVQMDGTVAGYSETGDPPFISVTMLDTGQFSVRSLFDTTNNLVVVQLANGKTVTGHSMTVMEALDVSNDEATFDVRWTGVAVTEAPSA